jgi:hypothetical protein
MINWKKWFKESRHLTDFQIFSKYERYWTSYVALFRESRRATFGSPEFAGTPEKENFDGFHNNKLSSHYDFGQEVGEAGMKMEVSERIQNFNFWLWSAKSSTVDE